MTSHPKRPRDPNQLAKSIVDIATGEAQERQLEAKSAAKAKGGAKGGMRKAPRIRYLAKAMPTGNGRCARTLKAP